MEVVIQLLLAEVDQEQQRADALVAVREGMVLHQEVEKIGRLLLARSVEGLAEHGLLDIPEDPLEDLAARNAE